MNRHTLRVLEFEKIRDRVRERCLTAEAAHALKRERIATDADHIRTMLTNVVALRRAISTSIERPPLSFPPLEATLGRLSKPGLVLEPIELAEIAAFVRSAIAMRDWLAAASAEAGTADTVASLIAQMPDAGRIADHLFRFVETDGSIREREIPELRAIRGEILRAQQDLQRSATALAGRDDVRRLLSATVPTQRDGRTVLALKADHRGKLPGIVHEVSGSGATVFIEPEELVARNNAVVEADHRYRNALLRILRDLSDSCRAELGVLRAVLDCSVSLDLLLCRARYGYDIEGERADSSSESIRLTNARHPLLAAPVPITVEIAAGTRLLIVTGPNTGGKTVTLKTIGLLALMNQFGIEVPAGAGSELPIFTGVYADIGDEQSIEQNLSTFSGHMRNIARILNHADDRSLVLLDELGSGTDPEEGGALAMAILDELLERGPFTVVTTHHGRLKHFGFTHERAVNASVEFDSKSLRPTYSIIPGVPGSSHAVEIAAQMGLLRSVTGRARDYLAGEEYDTGRIIRRLTDREQELHRETRRLALREAELDRAREALNEHEVEIRRREVEVRRGTLRDLESWAADVRSRLENLVREIREGELTREKTRAVKEFIGEMDERLAAERGAVARTGETGGSRSEARSAAGSGGDRVGADGANELGPGVPVRIVSKGTEGRIHRRGKGESWIVQVGPVRLPVEAGDLVPVRANVERTSVSYSGSMGRAAFELDVRGYRLEDALAEVERQIDQALLSGMVDFSIIHGTGEGVLQKGIHDQLRNHHHVASFAFARPEEGGFGKTNVRLKH